MNDIRDLLRAVLERPSLDAPRAAYAAYARAEGCETPSGEFSQVIGGLSPGVVGEGLAVTALARSAWRSGYTARAGWRGGFIEQLDLPIAAFLAHAAELFAAHPITHVRLADKRARPTGTAGGVQWTRALVVPVRSGALHPVGARAAVQSPSDLPPELFAAGLTWAVIDTAGQADEALSAACVAFGRRLAGLSFLP